MVVVLLVTNHLQAVMVVLLIGEAEDRVHTLMAQQLRVKQDKLMALVAVVATMAGSMIPAFTRSSYFPLDALKP